MPATGPTKSPSSPKATGAPTSAPIPYPTSAHRMIVLTSMVPATDPRIVGFGGVAVMVGVGLIVHGGTGWGGVLPLQ